MTSANPPGSLVDSIHSLGCQARSCNATDISKLSLLNTPCLKSDKTSQTPELPLPSILGSYRRLRQLQQRCTTSFTAPYTAAYPKHQAEKMASVSVSTVTVTVTAKAVAATTAAARAAAQGGILEGANPSKYDAKNPIIIFIIQASLTPDQGLGSLTVLVGWHHHHFHPSPTLSPLQDSPASRHC